MATTLEGLADLVCATSNNTNMRIDQVQDETYGMSMSVRSGVLGIRQSLDLADTVARLQKRIEALEAEVKELRQAG